MGSSVYLKMKDGRRVPMLADTDRQAADALKADLERWVQQGQTLSVTHASGEVEDLTPRGVQAIEVVELRGRSHPDPV
jgi:hypothetical protein